MSLAPSASGGRCSDQRTDRRTDLRADRRIALIDALRAFALIGILQVNIQSFVWGAGDPLGFFGTPPTATDALVHLLIGTLVSLKFMSLFAFLFGVGFALQWRRLRARVGSAADAKRIYRRRLGFLLVVGFAHGALLYYGDILAFYALCGFVLLAYADDRTATLVRAARGWWIAFGLLGLALALPYLAAGGAGDAGGDPARIPASAVERFIAYTEAGYGEQLSLRINDYGQVLTSMALVSIPQVVGLFLLGALAGRLGWLAHPGRHVRVWRAAAWIGVGAAPLAVLGAWMNFRAMRDLPGDSASVGIVFQLFGSALVCLYVALAVRWRDHAAMRGVIAWLAPAGRMPLTNYLLQSLLMGALLSGWGLGLGAALGRLELALLACAFVAIQLVASRSWIARFGQGPVEAVWRAWTYRGVASASSTFSQTPR